MSKLMGLGGASAPPQMHVNMQEILKSGKPVVCLCGNDVFVPQMKAIIVSRIALSAPEDVIAQQIQYVCKQCDKLFDDLMEELKNYNAGTDEDESFPVERPSLLI